MRSNASGALLPQLLLLVLVLVLVLMLSADAAPPERTLLWVSRPSGLFSQFLQLREMLGRARQYKRHLLVANFTSTHFRNASMSLCDVFNLTSVQKTVTCYTGVVRNSSEVPCRNSLFSYSKEFRSQNVTNACFSGLLFGSRGKISEQKRLGLMAAPPRLSFASRYMQTFTNHISPRLPVNATVVHWRRGDQLATRCRKGWVGLKDTSVNCANASALVRDVRANEGGNLGEAVLVATNEQDEAVLAELRAARGFTVLGDVLRGWAGARGIDGFDAFVYEALAMLHAPVLITLGISTINDIIESARRDLLPRRPYCTRASSERDKESMSWCHLRAKAAAAAETAAASRRGGGPRAE